uniref:Uncharacterized protein n=1 Tax=Caenorhabditis japonica TaxID=281687 RepID=A0A8R1HPX1_CAEJA
MSGHLRNVYFILESIDISDIVQRFSVFLKLENYELVALGEFIKTELPQGLNFPVLLNEKWFENPEFELEIRTEKSVFAGILGVGKTDEKNFLTSSGVATVYDTKNSHQQLDICCTIVIEDASSKIGNAQKREEIMVTRETQTEKERRKRDAKSQTTPPATPPPQTTLVSVDASTNTPSHQICLSEEEMQQIVLSHIERHLRARAPDFEPLRSNDVMAEEVEDPAPSKVELPDLNSFNLVPRLAKLRDLDQLIQGKSKILNELKMEIEVRRKTQQVLEKRQIGEEDSMQSSEAFEDSSTPTTSSESTSSSNSQEDNEEEEVEEEESSSSTSESESKESMKSDNKEKEKPQKIEENVEEESIEDPFSSRQPPTPPSPATQYLENLRKKIMENYQKNM